MDEIVELKKLLKDVSKKDITILQESWKECIKQGYLKKFPRICQDSYIKKLTVDDYKKYIFDEREKIEDRYARYFRMCLEFGNPDFELTNDEQKLIYKKILKETINNFDFIKCIQDDNTKDNERIYIYIIQYLPNSNHAPSVQIEKIFHKLKTHFKQVFIISTTPYPYPYPDKTFKSFNYSGVDENAFYKLDENVFYVEFRGYLTEALYLEFVKHQQYTQNDKFLLVGHSSIHFDLIDSERKIVLPTSMSVLNLNSANFIISMSKINERNIFEEEYITINTSTDFTRTNNLPFKIKEINLDNITIAIVGNRLDLELDLNLLEALERLLIIFPKIRIEIVGVFSNNKSISVNLLKHMKFINYSPNLSQYFYDEVDFFVNPKRQGGGQSSVMAFKVGVPIITLPFGDVYECIEKKYSINSYDEIEDFIIRYIKDFEFKNKIDSINRELTLDADQKFNLMINEVLKIGS